MRRDVAGLAKRVDMSLLSHSFTHYSEMSILSIGLRIIVSILPCPPISRPLIVPHPDDYAPISTKPSILRTFL